MKVVLSLGGSIIVPGKVDINFLKKFRQIILDFVKKGNKVAIIAGGGMTARAYQEASRKLSPKVSQEDLDWVGIKATHLNAELVRTVFGSAAYEKVIENPTARVKTKKPIFIGAGWKPGCSTDKDAVLLAKNLGMKTIVNLTNIEYVYDKDPRKFRDAKPLKDITWKQMQKIVGTKWIPGANLPFDPVATKECAKHNLRVVIMRGTDLKNLKNFLAGKKYKGTTIS
jgi:uridylate kinase